MLRGTLVGLLVLGTWGLSCFVGAIAMVPIEQLESPDTTQILQLPQPPRSPQAPPKRKKLRAKVQREMSGDCDPAAPPSPAKDLSLLPETQALVGKLLGAPEFAPGFNADGVPNEDQKVMLQLAHQPDAIAAFDWLASQPRPVPQLYAYWALRTLSREHARAHIPDLSHDLRTVTAVFDDFVSYPEVRDLERDIAGWVIPDEGLLQAARRLTPRDAAP
jgi:hypothetical protein